MNQIKDTKINYEIVYVGGGNISLLNEAHLDKLLSFLSQFNVREFSVECNPNDLKEADIMLFKKYGVNRFVLGIQQEKEKPYHPYNFKEAVLLLRQHQLFNISFDIPFAISNQSEASYLKNLHDLIALKPKHFALYSCESELDTKLYFKSIEILSKYGYKQYEISNFAKKNYESQMNLVYYHGEDMHAFGLGSNFKVDNIRKTWTDDLESYLGEDQFLEIENLSQKDAMFETLMMGFRLKEGISLEKFKKKYQMDLLDVYLSKIESMKEYLDISDTHIKVNEKGYHLLDDILINFME